MMMLSPSQLVFLLCGHRCKTPQWRKAVNDLRLAITGCYYPIVLEGHTLLIIARFQMCCAISDVPRFRKTDLRRPAQREGQPDV